MPTTNEITVGDRVRINKPYPVPIDGPVKWSDSFHGRELTVEMIDSDDNTFMGDDAFWYRTDWAELIGKSKQPKYKIGDKVLVKRSPEDSGWVPPMDQHIGKVRTIKHVTRAMGVTYYKLAEDLGEWNFQEESLRSVDEMPSPKKEQKLESGDFVYIDIPYYNEDGEKHDEDMMMLDGTIRIINDYDESDNTWDLKSDNDWWLDAKWLTKVEDEDFSLLELSTRLSAETKKQLLAMLKTVDN